MKRFSGKDLFSLGMSFNILNTYSRPTLKDYNKSDGSLMMLAIPNIIEIITEHDFPAIYIVNAAKIGDLLSSDYQGFEKQIKSNKSLESIENFVRDLNFVDLNIIRQSIKEIQANITEYLLDIYLLRVNKQATGLDFSHMETGARLFFENQEVWDDLIQSEKNDLNDSAQCLMYIV